MKSQLMPEEKQTGCLKLSGSRGGREDEGGSQTLCLFPWKAAASEKGSASPFCSKEMSQLTSVLLLMAVVSRVLYWKGQPSSHPGEKIARGNGIN